MFETKNREIWIDNIKVFACILVVVGHFFQSMTKANILPENNVYLWFNQTIYYFHVPLFFICSGYLYQKNSKVERVSDWEKNVLKKVLDFGIPYFTFSIITWILKTIFSNQVNNEVDGILKILFVSPIPPYWYLYCLFLIFLITPTLKNRRIAVLGLVLAFTFKIISICVGMRIRVYAVSVVLSNEIWFIVGMCLYIFDFQNIKQKTAEVIGIATGTVFFLLSILVYQKEIEFNGISFFMGVIACISVIILFLSFFKEKEQNKIFKFLIKYTMPIFLMHTIFAATIRSILAKIGISNGYIHIIVGIGGSFIGPILAAIIMEKYTWMKFFLYPRKYVKISTRYNEYD